MLERVRSAPHSAIRYDEAHWPFVVVTMPKGALTDEQLTEHLRDIDRYAQRGGAYGFVVDPRQGEHPTAVQRRQIAAAMDKNAQRDGSRFVGIAIVIDSFAARAIFTGLMWLRKTTQPMTAVGSVEDGLSWLADLQRQSTLH